MAKERLQKVLARAGVASRRGAEQLVREGRVQVAGRVVVEQGLQVDPDEEMICVDGRRISAEPSIHLVFNKPREVVSTMRDPQGRPCVADFVKGVGARVVPVGRLDYQTSGVLLLTNDGALARALLHPSGKVRKEYLLKVKGSVDEQALARFRDSIQIDGSWTRPAQVSVTRASGDKTWLSLALSEGKNRQIRRLAEHAGYPVMRLVRTSFAGITADGLAPGQFRPLSSAELGRLTQLPAAKRSSGKD